jgi:hypothetical protein
MIVVGCHLCADDITVRAFGDNTHIIIDVMGYFDDAKAATATTAYMAGTSTPIAAGGNTDASGGACPAGTTLVGGGTLPTSFLVFMVADTPAGFSSTTTWGASLRNTSGAAQSVTVESICLDTPIVLN